MDDIYFHALMNYAANATGFTPATILFYLGLIMAICNLIGRWIPDDAVGVLGVVRKICKVVGLYLSNRVSTNVSVNDVARVVSGTPVTVDDKALVVLKRDASGRFTKLTDELHITKHTGEEGFVAAGFFPVVALCALLMLSLTGCMPSAGVVTAGQHVIDWGCANADIKRQVANNLIQGAEGMNASPEKDAIINGAQTSLALLSVCG